MQDQLAIYIVPTDQLERITTSDCVADRELVQILERKGRFVGDLFLDGKVLRAILTRISAPLGAPVQALVARSTFTIDPSGPIIFTSHLDAGTASLIAKQLARAARALSNPEDDLGRALAAAIGDAATPQVASRLLKKVEKLLATHANARGEFFTVFTAW